MTVYTNCYINYFGEVCFSKGYDTMQEAIKARKRKDVEYIKKPIKVVLK
jgi:hypothetical protein